jgi:hypothetical protein
MCIFQRDLNGWAAGWHLHFLLLQLLLKSALIIYHGIDNVLDTISAPLAAIAGTLLTASFITGMSPIVQWTLAIIVGGGTAGLISTGTWVMRLGSSTTTGGLGNHILATIENFASLVLSILSLIIPVIMGIFTFGMMIFFSIKIFNRKKNRIAQSTQRTQKNLKNLTNS